MPSQALNDWLSTRTGALDGVFGALRALPRSKQVQRAAVQNLSRSYTVMLSAEFQGFCKDLHRECAEHFVSLVPEAIRDVVRQQFLAHRLLDRGDPNPGNIGADFNRLGLKLFDEARQEDTRTPDWRASLDELNEWRNAVAHNDYSTRRQRTTYRGSVTRMAVGVRSLGGRVRSCSRSPPRNLHRR